MPGYKLVKGDLSQLEFRICVWVGGEDPNIVDGAFEKIVEQSHGKFTDAARRLSLSERDVAKSVSHASNYAEGISLHSAKDLDNPRTIADRKAGALMAFDGRGDLPEWRFRGYFVCFTGANLAERLFGNRTREARAVALELQHEYFNTYPVIRKMQQEVCRKIEPRPSCIELSSGHILKAYNRSGEDDIKQMLATVGQGNGAIYAQEGLLNFADRGYVPNIHVHDENVFCDIPYDFSNDQCLEFMMPMVQKSGFMSGFSCPAKVKVGPNWKDTIEIGTIRV